MAGANSAGRFFGLLRLDPWEGQLEAGLRFMPCPASSRGWCGALGRASASPPAPDEWRLLPLGFHIRTGEPQAMTRLLVLFGTAFVDMVGLTMIIPLLRLRTERVPAATARWATVSTPASSPAPSRSATQLGGVERQQWNDHGGPHHVHERRHEQGPAVASWLEAPQSDMKRVEASPLVRDARKRRPTSARTRLVTKQDQA